MNDRDQLIADAVALRDRGLRIIPVGVERLPLEGRSWKPDATLPPADDARIESWVKDSRTHGWAILCGADDGIACLDIEVEGINRHEFIANLPNLAPESCQYRSPSGGVHVWVEVVDHEVAGALPTERLAHHDLGERFDEQGNRQARWELLAEVRGVSKKEGNAGSYAVIVGPGRPPLRDDFAPWRVTRAEVEALLADVRALDEYGPWKAARRAEKERLAAARPKRARTGASTADVLLRAAQDGWLEPTHYLPDGWEYVGVEGDRQVIRRPGAKSDTSGNVRDGITVIHSTAVEWAEPGEGWPVAKVLAEGRHGGDFHAAMQAVEDAALGKPSPYSEWPVEVLDAVRRTLRANRDEWQAGQERGEDESPRRRVQLTKASEIAPEPVYWLWHNRIALGAISLVAGAEGTGKSTLCYTLVADVTRGRMAGKHFGNPKAVLVVATEDSWAHTIVPRLMAAGADLDLVYRVEVITSLGTHAVLSLPKDNDDLEDAIEQTDPAMVLLDPLMSRIAGELDTHKDGEVRQALEPIADIAERTQVSVVGIIHFNKSRSSNPLDNVMASKAFTAVARSVSMVVRDSDDEAGRARLFGTPKNNLGPDDLPLMRFAIESHSIETTKGPAQVGRLVWAGEVTGEISDHIGEPVDSETRTLAAEAREWLSQYMEAAGGQVDAKTAINEYTKASGDDRATAKRRLSAARKKLGYSVEAVGFPASYVWSVSDAEDREDKSPGESAYLASLSYQASERGQVGQVGQRGGNGGTVVPPATAPDCPTHRVPLKDDRCTYCDQGDEIVLPGLVSES